MSVRIVEAAKVVVLNVIVIVIVVVAAAATASVGSSSLGVWICKVTRVWLHRCRSHAFNCAQNKSQQASQSMASNRRRKCLFSSSALRRHPVYVSKQSTPTRSSRVVSSISSIDGIEIGGKILPCGQDKSEMINRST